MPANRSCREVALGLLARRAHTKSELRTKLRRKGFEAGEIDATLEALAERGLQDDVSTASSFVKARSSRGIGTARLRAELSARGVRGEAAAEALSAVDPGEEAAGLRKLLERKERSLPAGLTGAARSKKLFDSLVRRGFAPSAVLEALRKKGLPDDEN